jgi:hypothetical protein
MGAEADRRMATEGLLKIAIEYKEHWGRVLAERARNDRARASSSPC